MTTTTTPLHKLAEQLASTAAHAAAFGWLPVFSDYQDTCQQAARLGRLAISLMAELCELRAASEHDPAVSARHATRLQGLARALTELWKKHRDTATKNEQLARDYSDAADTFTDVADDEWKEVAKIRLQLATLSATDDETNATMFP